jgi:hypothetical protein
MTAGFDALTAALCERYPFMNAGDAPKAAAILLRELADGIAAGGMPALARFDDNGRVEIEALFDSTPDELREALRTAGVLS